LTSRHLACQPPCIKKFSAVGRLVSTLGQGGIFWLPSMTLPGPALLIQCGYHVWVYLIKFAGVWRAWEWRGEWSSSLYQNTQSRSTWCGEFWAPQRCAPRPCALDIYCRYHVWIIFYPLHTDVARLWEEWHVFFWSLFRLRSPLAFTLLAEWPPGLAHLIQCCRHVCGYCVTFAARECAWWGSGMCSTLVFSQ
jgi:hypothetical protein